MPRDDQSIPPHWSPRQPGGSALGPRWRAFALPPGWQWGPCSLLQRGYGVHGAHRSRPPCRRLSRSAIAGALDPTLDAPAP
ncbi:hypothetical protein IT6_02745 [Methylacidiphilum caldifontis]|uniref:hypothetical protein n=1 Tax=Methylacidiphilum caldifontis TaxID=2795386 RepID=UPI001A8E78EC|nr:hypothetical protein [Methylacidiphilum caldifontis]QSR89220.1 hypothetical protein IT6_02745 [Methylacidiphilum caldifontis]